MTEEKDPNGLPVQDILTVLQQSGHPSLASLDGMAWYRIENCLREDVEEQSIPAFVQDQVNYHQKTLEIRGVEYRIREMQFADFMNLADIGPQIVQVFYNGDEKEMAKKNPVELAEDLVNRALSHRVKKAMSALSYRIIELLANLIVNPVTSEFMSANFLFGLRPEQSMQAIRQILECETLFFSYIQQSLPENMREGLNSVIGMIMPPTSKENLKSFTKG